MDGLEQIRLARAVFPHDHGAARRNAQFQLGEIAERTEPELAADQRGRSVHLRLEFTALVRARTEANALVVEHAGALLRVARSRVSQTPRNCAVRFSRKACIPSRMSCVLASRPNRLDSSSCASSSVVDTPRSTDSSASASATGP